MKIIGLEDTLGTHEKSIVTVGNFDGIHRGHTYLIDEIVRKARNSGHKSIVVTFEPHTRMVLYPELPQKRLTTFEEKAILLEQFGVDYLMRIPFSVEFSKLPPNEFVEKILLHKLHTTIWVMGEGHAIGKNRTGGKKFLHDIVTKYHITIFTADLFAKDEITISSTNIRSLVAKGHIAEAADMLGHPYLVNAERISGEKIGTQLGIPTLNFARPPSQKVLPPYGVYTAELEYNDTIWKGALYFGECPTFSNREGHFEFHSFDKHEPYPPIGKNAYIWIHNYIRCDKQFESKEELVDTIKQDIKKIRDFFSQEKLV
jgi:riboflavin kinase / FMN adenylyltransferase